MFFLDSTVVVCTENDLACEICSVIRRGHRWTHPKEKQSTICVYKSVTYGRAQTISKTQPQRVHSQFFCRIVFLTTATLRECVCAVCVLFFSNSIHGHGLCDGHQVIRRFSELLPNHLFFKSCLNDFHSVSSSAY